VTPEDQPITPGAPPTNDPSSLPTSVQEWIKNHPVPSWAGLAATLFASNKIAGLPTSDAASCALTLGLVLYAGRTAVHLALQGRSYLRNRRLPVLLFAEIGFTLTWLRLLLAPPSVVQLRVAAWVVLLAAVAFVGTLSHHVLASSGVATGRVAVRNRTFLGIQIKDTMDESWWPSRLAAWLNSGTDISHLMKVIVLALAFGGLLWSPTPVSRNTKNTDNGGTKANPLPSPDPVNLPPVSPTYQALCGAGIEPGMGAPAWAAPSLYSVILGHNGIGGAIAGCATNAVIITMNGTPDVVFQRAYDKDGQLASIATVRRGELPGIALNDAAHQLADLLDRGIPVNVGLRTTLGTGDGYVLHLKDGDGVLIRPTLKRAGQPLAYTYLSPTAAAAWSEAVRLSSRWVWPERSSDGFDLFTLPGHHVIGAMLTQDKTVVGLELNGQRVPFPPALPARAAAQLDVLVPAPRCAESSPCMSPASS
jgi:hypothetical protein